MTEIRITRQTLTVLSEMLSRPADEWYGLELTREANLASGTLYPILNRLEEAGWLTSLWENIDPAAEKRPRRRLYRLTDKGADNARQEVARALRQLGRASA